MGYQELNGGLSRHAMHEINYRDSGRALDAYFFPIDHNPNQILGRLSDFFLTWRNKLNGNLLPSLNDFELDTFSRWQEDMRLLTAGNGRFGERITISMGKRYAELWGRTTFKGQLENGKPPSADTINKIQQHIDYLHNPTFAIGVGTLPKLDAPATPALWLELPLSDNGADITHFVNAAIAI